MGNSLYCLSAFRAGVAVARVLPRSMGQWIGESIAVASYARRPQAQRALRANLQAVTGREGAALDALCLENVRNFGRMIADYFYCASRRPSVAANLVQRWRGFEHLEEARARGKGTIIVTAHLGHWELGGTLLADRGLSMTVITLDEPSTALTEWRDDYRQRAGIKTIPVGPGREFGFVEMIQTLRRNECLAMLVDR
ncbi:MAG: lysophospholipid acyltransferase family protein, partial [Chthoniobacteraceae bacterium]